MTRLLADENFPRPVAAELRRLGHDVVELIEMGLSDQGVSDAAVLDAATVEGRAVLTLDRRDFARLHLERPRHGGIVACTFDANFAAFAARIDTVLSEQGDLHTQFVRIVRPGPAPS